MQKFENSIIQQSDSSRSFVLAYYLKSLLGHKNTLSVKRA